MSEEQGMPEPLVIRLMAPASGKAAPFVGQYLVEYDPTRPGTAPDGRSMRAHIVCSPDAGQAKRFATPAEAHAYWTAKSGDPRGAAAAMPLAYWTILVESAPEAEHIDERPPRCDPAAEHRSETCADCGQLVPGDGSVTGHEHCGPLPHTGPAGGPYCERCGSSAEQGSGVGRA